METETEAIAENPGEELVIEPGESGGEPTPTEEPEGDKPQRTKPTANERIQQLTKERNDERQRIADANSERDKLQAKVEVYEKLEKKVEVAPEPELSEEIQPYAEDIKQIVDRETKGLREEVKNAREDRAATEMKAAISEQYKSHGHMVQKDESGNEVVDPESGLPVLSPVYQERLRILTVRHGKSSLFTEQGLPDLFKLLQDGDSEAAKTATAMKRNAESVNSSVENPTGSSNSNPPAKQADETFDQMAARLAKKAGVAYNT